MNCSFLHVSNTSKFPVASTSYFSSLLIKYIFVPTHKGRKNNAPVNLASVSQFYYIKKINFFTMSWKFVLVLFLFS